MDGRRRLAMAFDAWIERSGLTQTEIAAAGGPSTTTQTKVRLTNGPVARQTLKQIDAVTGWPAGTASDILKGALAEPPTDTQRVQAVVDAGDAETKNAFERVVAALDQVADAERGMPAVEASQALIDALNNAAERCRIAGSSAFA